MSTVKNNTHQPRFIHLADAKGNLGDTVILPPKGTLIDVSLFGADNPVYRAWHAAGDVDFGDAIDLAVQDREQKAEVEKRDRLDAAARVEADREAASTAVAKRRAGTSDPAAPTA